MKKPLSKSLTLYTTAQFPKYFGTSNKPFKAVIGFGGNIGNLSRRFQQMIRLLSNDRQIDVVATSPLLMNPAFGFKDQPDFVNGVMEIQTVLHPNELLKKLLFIERCFRRVRTFKNAPRTLDLDIIFFESKRVYNTKLIIPHPHWQERESVVIPLQLLARPKYKARQH